MDARANTNWLEDLKREFPRYWRELPHKGFLFGLLAAWCALFQFLGNSTFGYIDSASLFVWLYDSYNAALSEDGHGNLIPFVVLGLLWYKRGDWGPLKKDLWAPAMLGLVAGLLFHIVGYIIQQPRLSVIGFLIGLYFLTGLTWGRAWLRTTLFPFALLAFCIPVGSLAESLTFPLRLISTKITVLVCHLVMGIGVIRDGVQIVDPKGSYVYEVAAACSGIRSLIALGALTTIYGFVTFRTGWKQLLCVALAVPLAVAGNVLRLTCIVVAAEAFGQGAAHFVHEWFGFLTFGLAIGAVMFLGWWLREDDAPGPAPVEMAAMEGDRP